MQTSNLILLLLILLGANLPWFSDKLFYVVPLAGRKHAGWCLLELIVLYFIMGAIAVYAEQSLFGQIAPQDWEFYAITACLFLVFSFPGFVYKFLWR